VTINYLPIKLRKNVVALFDMELDNECQMLRDARRRDEIPQPTTLNSVLDSIAQGLALPDGFDTDDWLQIVKLVRDTYGSEFEVEAMVESWHNNNKEGN
jgi:hypothetical protein